MQKLILTASLFTITCFGASSGKQKLVTPNSYNGVPITQDTLYTIALEFEKQCRAQYKGDSSHPKMAYADIEFRDITRSALYTNGAHSKLEYNKAYRKKQIKRLETVQPPIQTFQYASIAAFSLIAHEAIKKKKIVGIKIPLAYVLSPDNKSINDTMVHIHQEVIEGELLEKWLKHGGNITEDLLQSLFAITESIGLRSLQKNIIVTNQGELCIVELMQPSETTADEFFYQKDCRYHENVVRGIKEGLFTIFKDRPKEKRALIEMVQESTIINHTDFTQKYQHEILKFVKKQKQ